MSILTVQIRTAECGQERIIRFSHEEASESTGPFLKSIQQIARELLPDADKIRTTYVDEEGDACTLTDETVSDALTFARPAEDGTELQLCIRGEGARAAPAAASAVPTGVAGNEGEAATGNAAAREGAATLASDQGDAALPNSNGSDSPAQVGCMHLAELLAGMPHLVSRMQVILGELEDDELFETLPLFNDLFVLEDTAGRSMLQKVHAVAQVVRALPMRLQQKLLERALTGFECQGTGQGNVPSHDAEPACQFAGGACPLAAAPARHEDASRAEPRGQSGARGAAGGQPAEAMDLAVGFHRDFTCDGCGEFPIVGTRYKSLEKRDYDLCPRCHGLPESERLAKLGLLPSHKFEAFAPAPPQPEPEAEAQRQRSPAAPPRQGQEVAQEARATAATGDNAACESPSKVEAAAPITGLRGFFAGLLSKGPCEAAGTGSAASSGEAVDQTEPLARAVAEAEASSARAGKAAAPIKVVRTFRRERPTSLATALLEAAEPPAPAFVDKEADQRVAEVGLQAEWELQRCQEESQQAKEAMRRAEEARQLAEHELKRSQEAWREATEAEQLCGIEWSEARDEARLADGAADEAMGRADAAERSAAELRAAEMQVCAELSAKMEEATLNDELRAEVAGAKREAAEATERLSYSEQRREGMLTDGARTRDHFKAKSEEVELLKSMHSMLRAQVAKERGEKRQIEERAIAVEKEVSELREATAQAHAELHVSLEKTASLQASCDGIRAELANAEADAAHCTKRAKVAAAESEIVIADMSSELRAQLEEASRVAAERDALRAEVDLAREHAVEVAQRVAVAERALGGRRGAAASGLPGAAAMWDEDLHAEDGAAQGRAPSAAVVGSAPLTMGVEMQEDPSARGDVTAELEPFCAHAGARQAHCLGRVRLCTGSGDAPMPACTVVKLTNDGEVPWPETAAVALLAGESMGVALVPLDPKLPGEVAEVELDLLVPSRQEAGELRSVWTVADAATGKPLGPLLVFEATWTEQ